MSDSDSAAWVNHYHFILPDADESRVLLLPGAEGYALPYVRMEGVWLSEAKRSAAALRAEHKLDFPFTILRYVSILTSEGEVNERGVSRVGGGTACGMETAPTRARPEVEWALARPLCALHHAVSYRYLVNSLEPHTQRELLHGLPDFLRDLLAALRAEPIKER